MKKFSTDAAGFAALTISELMLQQCVINGLFSSEEAQDLLRTAACRHEEAAEGTEEKVALNMEVARLLRALATGLVPLFREHRQRDIRPSAAKPFKSINPTWVRFPD
jgi:hypothetical protein